MKKLFVLLLLCATISFAQDYVQGKITVKLREQALQGMVRNANGTATLPNAASFNALARQHGIVSLKPMSPKPNSVFRKYFEVQFPQNANLQAIESAFQNNPQVEWASRIPAEIPEPLDPYIPLDPFMQDARSWYLNQGTNIADINAPEAWEWNSGDPNIIIAICGGGIKAVTEPGHPQYSADVAANLWTNPGEIPNNNYDDDGNGFVDDIHGWNFRLNNNDIEYKDPNPGWDPLYWHGTPMASEAASAIDNCAAANCGVGVSPLSRIMGVPHAGAQSIVYAVDNGARVLAYSWGTSPSSYFNQIVKDAFYGGMMVVNAGGNTIGGTLYDYPPCGISVATVDSKNYTITTTGPDLKICSPAMYGGSSYASPVVAGVLALMMNRNQYLSNEQLRTILLDINSTNPVFCPSPPFCYTGAGRVDAFKAVKNAAATAILNSVTANKRSNPVISWSHNVFVSAGLFPTTSLQYLIERRISGGAFSVIATVAGTATSYTDGSLIIVGIGDPTQYRIVTKVTYGADYVFSVPSNTGSCRTSPPYKIGNTDEELPAHTQLLGNYPNPFNPTTNIAFTLAKEGAVSLKIFDILGKEVATLVNQENRAVGRYTVPFDATQFAGGVYYYRLESNGYTSTKKLVLLK